MKKELLIVVGIQSNYRSLLKDAIDTGSKYDFTTRILDLNELVEGWKPYPNDWDELGVSSFVDKINDFRHLKQFARGKTNKNQTIILFLYPPAGKLRKAWKILQKTFPNTGLITISPVPNANRQTDHSAPVAGQNAIKSILRKAKSLIKPVPSIWVISGTECIPIFTSYFRSHDATKFIYTHSLEFEFLHYGRKTKHPENLTKKDYILVLDQGWFSKPKPDFLTDKQYPPASRQKFSEEISQLLDHLYQATGREVIVSCHPKADIYDTKKLYLGYKVVNLPTAKLIQNCSMAIANSSTSIGYAVMADKPLVLFTSDELSRSIIHSAELAISRELNIEFINISENRVPDIEELTSANRRKQYVRYCQRYIRQDRAPKLSLWDTVFSGLD
jgi:hypothetical protein